MNLALGFPRVQEAGRLLLTASLLSLGLEGAEPIPTQVPVPRTPATEDVKHHTIYRAIVADKKIEVTLGIGSFDPSKHSFRYSRDLDNYVVDGAESSGIDRPPVAGSPILVSLTVKIGGMTFECPKHLIRNKFDPSTREASFDARFVNNRVTVSADAKTVSIEISQGDAASTTDFSLTMTDAGKWVEGMPIHSTP